MSCSVRSVMAMELFAVLKVKEPPDKEPGPPVVVSGVAKVESILISKQLTSCLNEPAIIRREHRSWKEVRGDASQISRALWPPF